MTVQVSTFVSAIKSVVRNLNKSDETIDMSRVSSDGDSKSKISVTLWDQPSSFLPIRRSDSSYPMF